jgi:uridine kinase
MSPFLIGIAGPSCSGKSEVARRLARILRAPIVALDHYYKDLKHIPFEERVKTNFDAPDSLDSDLIAKHACKLKRREGIDEPSYDFAHHIRAESTEHIEPADFVILEGLFALYWPEVRAMLDARIYITAGHDVCLERRIYRDMRERGRTEESVRSQYAATVRPMCDQYVAPTQEFAEVVLTGADPLKQSVHSLLIHVADRMQDPAKQSAIRQSLSTWMATADDFQFCIGG